MVQWIALIATAIAGIYAATLDNSTWLADVSAAMITLATVCALALIYFLTSISSAHHDGSRWPRRVAFFVIALASVLAITWLKPPLQQPVDNSETIAVGAAAQRQGPVSVRIRRSADGRFSTTARIDGATVAVTIDSGASSIVLRQTDAQRAGINLSGLSYDTPVSTASGMVYTAAIRVQSVQVGLISISDIEALVARPGTLNESLLGMNFLTRLTSHEIAGEFMTLRN